MSGEPLPPFSGDETKCVKCGNVGAYTNYRKKGEPSPGRIAVGAGPPERLDRVCARCDYTWPEACVPTGEATA
ncbi:hypothetical protein [Streptomyces sp. NPDC003832]